VNQINVSLANEQLATREAAIARITALLRASHNVAENDFTIQSQDQLLETVSQVTGTLTLFLGAVAGISLVVGGIGIMNIMIVSVTERTREIGIRKAVGATRLDILLQFLVEALTVSAIGGGIGVVLGVVVARFAGGLPGLGPGSGSASALVTPDSIVLALGVSLAVGLFFGIYPAFTASRLRPIEALRYE
jgi:putative ABC transport system permease protein